MRIIASGLVFLLAVGPALAAPRSSIVGTWRGTSTCVKGSGHPACRDEVVVYEFRYSPASPGSVMCKASKIVDGKAEEMGQIGFTYAAAQDAWLGEFQNPHVHGLWTFVVRGDELTGTLVDLPSKHLVRKVAVRRDKAAP